MAVEIFVPGLEHTIPYLSTWITGYTALLAGLTVAFYFLIERVEPVAKESKKARYGLVVLYAVFGITAVSVVRAVQLHLDEMLQLRFYLGFSPEQRTAEANQTLFDAMGRADAWGMWANNFLALLFMYTVMFSALASLYKLGAFDEFEVWSNRMKARFRRRRPPPPPSANLSGQPTPSRSPRRFLEALRR